MVYRRVSETIFSLIAEYLSIMFQQGATEGFSFVLAGAKALLEHGLQLNLVPDRFPDGLPTV